MTLDAWINPTTLNFPGSGFGTIVSKSNYPSRNYALFVENNGAIELNYIHASGAASSLSQPLIPAWSRPAAGPMWRQSSIPPPE